MTTWDQTRWMVVDVEGNGAHPPELVELALVEVVGGRIGEPRTWLVRPPTRITWMATKVHKIGNADVAGCPAVQEVAADILAALAPAHVIVGHQVRVDLDVLTRTLPEWTPPQVLDTLRVARKLYAEHAGHSLAALAESFGLAGDLDGHAHRAGYDATVTARLLMRMIADLGGEPTTESILAVNPMPASAQLPVQPPVQPPAQGQMFLDV